MTYTISKPIMSQHSDKTFILWTTSLARAIGTQEATDFNNQMRQYALANDMVLFDVADIVSHTDQGAPCYDNRNDGHEHSRHLPGLHHRDRRWPPWQRLCRQDCRGKGLLGADGATRRLGWVRRRYRAYGHADGANNIDAHRDGHAYLTRWPDVYRNVYRTGYRHCASYADVTDVAHAD